MHTILGAGGPVANALTTELVKNNVPVRLVSRRPVDIEGNNITWRKADLLDYKQVQEAAQGATVIYLARGWFMM